MKTIQKLLKRKRRDLKIFCCFFFAGITGGVGDYRHFGVNRVA